MEIEQFKIKRGINDKDLFLALLNIYNLGYTVVYLSGNLRALLEGTTRSFLNTFISELHIYLEINNFSELPAQLLKYPIKGIFYKTEDLEAIRYIKQVYPYLELRVK